MPRQPLYLPDEQPDSKENATILYTVTIAIAISLFIYVITPISEQPDNDAVNWIRVLSAIFLAISSILLYTAIDSLGDVVTFRYFYYHKLWYIKNVYKWTLINYNIASILIIISIWLLLIDFLLSKLPYPYIIWPFFLFALGYSIKKLVKDIIEVYKSEVVELSPTKREEN